jgi:hypothetical protein
MAFAKDTSRKQLSDLTLEEVKRIQKPAPGYVLAVGKYQAIPATFRSWLDATNIPTSTVFNASTQERLGDWLITGKRPVIGRYVEGSQSVTVATAQLELAKEFASIPVPYDLTNDRGTFVRAGESYYKDRGGNRAGHTVAEVRTALEEARRTKNLQSLKQFIAKGEGGYDSLNRGVGGDTPTYSPEYYSALSRIPSATSPAVSPTISADVLSNYIKNTYVIPVSSSYSGDNKVNTFLIALAGIQGKVPAVNNKTYKEWLSENAIYSRQQLDGELELLNIAAQANVQLAAEAKENLSKIDGLIPAEAAYLVQQNLFELQPDLMRQKMSANAIGPDGIVPNYSHAWRSPGKLAITADLTIPGASGFKIGQIFRVGRTYNYDNQGAYQLFGLTEDISIGKGWTTTIHSRFNAMPIAKIYGLQSE